MRVRSSGSAFGFRSCSSGKILRLPAALALAILGFGLAPSPARAQDVFVGWNLPFDGNVDPSRTETFVALSGATTGGFVTSATFGWSATGCPAAAKIKFFRPLGSGFFNYVGERGPFDVTNPLQPAGTVPPVTQTVALDPPVAIREGDVIAITNLTACGGPTWGPASIPLPGLPVIRTVVFEGDPSEGVGPESVSLSAEGVFVYGTGPTRGLGLLSGRFEITLSATNPRTGQSTVGTARALSDVAGYFSLPDFAGDSSFPEITVKMVDATAAAPPFGGSFWFFYSSLTDVSFTLTITDHRSGRVRSYSNAGSPLFCGGADTNAFPP